MANIVNLQNKARWVRQQVLEMIACAGKGHIGGSFSCVEILVALYYGGILHYNPKNPSWDERDRFILSKGHACATLYTILADLRFFPISELKSFNREDSRLEGHPHRGIPGIEADTGSLGHGLGIGAGLALSTKINKGDWMTIVLLSDGECHEGSVWEAAMFAAHYKLNNLIAIIDYNQQCSTDFIKDCVRLEPLAYKWRAFGWEVKEINGHNFKEILSAFNNFRYWNQGPLMIIANTIKGKGVSFMEGQLSWHHRVPEKKELEKAREELAID